MQLAVQTDHHYVSAIVTESSGRTGGYGGVPRGAARDDFVGERKELLQRVLRIQTIGDFCELAAAHLNKMLREDVGLLSQTLGGTATLQGGGYEVEFMWLTPTYDPGLKKECWRITMIAVTAVDETETGGADVRIRKVDKDV